MSSTLQVYCLNTRSYIPFEGGDTLSDVYLRVKDQIPFVPICARVNNKSQELQYPLFAPKQVEFLSAASASGRRCYIRSLCMMLYRAVDKLYPGHRLDIEHAVSRGYFCRVGDLGLPLDEVAAAVKAEMKRLVEQDIPFVRHEQPTAAVIEIFRRQGLHDKVKLISTLHELYTVYYRLDGLADSYYGPLAPSTGVLATFDLVAWQDGLLLLGPDPADLSRPMDPQPQPRLFDAFKRHLTFNSIIGTRDAGDVNRLVERKETSMMINVAEALHTKYIAEIADEITRRYHDGGSRIVLVAGPSSSGKTTFTKRLSVQLLTCLVKPVMISLDDYFVDRDKTPVDEGGELDYESLYALDLKLFNEHLTALLAGEEVELPSYNFETGMREYHGNRISLNNDTVLLIEGIHGLNPELTSAIPRDQLYKIYVSALATLSIDDHNWVSTTDNRLLRRIIRDYKYRGTSPLDTIRRWASVRRGEERWIFPYQENADSMFNSSLLFEMGVMRDEAERVLRDVPRDLPEYGEAWRLRRFLSYFLPIPSTMIPPTSLLREFLGGSSFHY